MTVPDQRPKSDLSALRIDRDEEPSGSFPLGRILTWLIALVVIGAIAYVIWNRVVVPQRAPLVETSTVKATIQVANAPLLTATGYLVANKQSKITPKISGKVVRINFDTGTKVRRGDILAVLESTNLKAQLDEGEAALGEAQREYDRQSALWHNGVTSRALVDSAEAQLKSAKARVQQVRINMQDMVVRAPFDGTIATKNTEVGEVISSVTMGQVAGTLPAGAICTLVDLKTLEVEADVNEGSIGQLHEGQPAEVTVDAFPGQKWKGVLRQIIPTADRAKAIVKVKVAIIDPAERLLPEMSASVSFLNNARTDAELHEPARIWIPTAALTDAKRVAVISADKHVQLKPVTTGAVRDNRIEITGGVREGDRIATTNVDALRDGQLIRLNEGQE